MSDFSLLMARDPLKHTEQDIDAIIAHYRNLRVTYKAGPAVAAPKLTKAETEVKGLGLSLKLELGK